MNPCESRSWCSRQVVTWRDEGSKKSVKTGDVIYGRPQEYVKVSKSWSDPPLALPLVLRDHVLRGKLKRITVYRQERTAA